jgi:hypothetical protein
MGAIQMPAAITGTTLTYQITNKVDASGDPTGWETTVEGSDYTGTALGNVTVAADVCIPIDPRVMQHRFFRVNMGSGQAADRTITVFLKG